MINTKKFTMIEILVVLAIIGVAIGILVPSLGGAMKKAKKNKAKTSMKTLSIAIRQYETTYGFLPFTGLGSDTLVNAAQYQTLLNTLAALDVTSNPRKIKFLELDKNNQFQDSWQNDFNVTLDLNYDSVLSDNVVYGEGSLNTTLGLWSCGPDGNHSSTDSDASNSDNVNSWD